jgi:hypothetical protein
MSTTFLLLLIILLLLVVLCMKWSSNKSENMNYTSSECPKGFVPSINTHACVLPGEKLPPCNDGQQHADRACRIPLGNTPIPKGWYPNYSKTGIWSSEYDNQW